MTLLLLAAIFFVQDAKKEPVPFLPADGRTRIFAVTKTGPDAQPKPETWELAPAGDLKGVQLVHFEPKKGDAGPRARLVDRRDPKDPGLFAMRKDGDVRWVIEETPGELRIFRRGFDNGPITLDWTIPADCRDGAKWTAHQTFMSCGFGSRPLDFEAKADKVTVAAGTFDALRVEVSYQSRPGGKEAEAKCVVAATLWIARGQGLLKAQVDGCTVELREIAAAPGR